MRGSWKAIVAYPPTWVAMAAVVLGVVALLVYFEPPPILAISVVAVGVIAAIGWPLTLSATGTMAARSSASHKLEEPSDTELRMLADRLAQLEDARPAQQLSAAPEKRDDLLNLLEKRIAAGERGYESYRPKAELMYFAVVRNLREFLDARSQTRPPTAGYVPPPPPGYTRPRPGYAPPPPPTQVPPSPPPGYAPPPPPGRGSASPGGIAGDLLDQNDRMLTLVDRTSTAIADSQIGLTPIEASEAMDELEDVAERKGRYATV